MAQGESARVSDAARGDVAVVRQTGTRSEESLLAPTVLLTSRKTGNPPFHVLETYGSRQLSICVNHKSDPSIIPQTHAVQFYGSEASLFNTVSGFLSQGLVDGQPVIVIATAAHWSGISEQLAVRFIDVDRARDVGQLEVLDAEKTLSLFMVGDMPNAVAFESTVGRTIVNAARGRPSSTLVRAYGEMVDVLWKDGRCDAAIRLEILWNKLAARHGLALLCGYAMGHFYKETSKFEAVCRQHTHVMPPDRDTVAFSS
jgi:hypothetical protein